jgi:flagellar L-ring protein precursor FlgH
LISAAAVPAAAQRNSLFGGSRSRAVGTVPTTQPAGSIRQGELGARASLQAERVEPRPNATLLRLSPFAVAKPEPQKIKVHDLITIIIRESKTATTDSKMQSKKDWKLDAELSKWLRLSDKHGVVPAGFEAGNPSVVFDLKNDYGGDGKYDRKDELTTRVTARVADVKPNGNLVLEATKQITIDDEGYTITLTGECRGQDVNPDNTILSTQIAGPEINVQHTGTVRDATRRGWLMRALDLLRPF